jgi:hypothetical protein
MPMSASAVTLPDRCSARAVATVPPVECPITVTRPAPSRSSAAPTRLAWAGMSYPPAGLPDFPCPSRSTRMTWQEPASGGTTRSHQAVRDEPEVGEVRGMSTEPGHPDPRQSAGP